MSALSTGIAFEGPDSANLFGRQVTASLDGLISRNIVGGGVPLAGFVHASIDGRPWSDTMWFRDAATTLRELVHFGASDVAERVWGAMIAHLEPGPEGYLRAPEYVHPGRPSAGREVDATAALIAAGLLLAEHAAPASDIRRSVVSLLDGRRSPIRSFVAELEGCPFLAGSGEFGGGMADARGLYFNTVQNAQAAMILDRVAESPLISAELAAQASQRARTLKESIRSSMLARDGSWIWALDAGTREPIASSLDLDPANKGFSGINGILAFAADAYGLVPDDRWNWFLAPAASTFYRLLSEPARLRRFSEFGMYAQWDLAWDGALTSPSYGQGFAIQCLSLLERLDLVAPAIEFLAERTASPGYPVERDSSLYFYERLLAPDISRPSAEWSEGCGALNAVNVAEPAKCARVLAGVDDRHDEIRLVPRAPRAWTDVHVVDAPLRWRRDDDAPRISAHAMSDAAGAVQRVAGRVSGTRRAVVVRLGPAGDPTWVHAATTADGSFDVSV